MSVDFSNSSTDGYQNTGADAYPSRQAWSWCGWIKLDDTSGVGYITFIGGGVYYEGFYFSGSQVYAATDGGGGLLATPAVTTWRFFAGKFDGSTPYLYWADWGDASLSSGTASPNASTAFTTDTIIFSDSGSDDNALGGLAYAFRWWDAVLTEEEFESERYSAVPYRKQDLTHFLPLLVQSSDPLDFAAASGSWNSSGSPATALDNPPVGWGYSPSGLSIPASAGGATVTVAGTATATGSADADLHVDRQLTATASVVATATADLALDIGLVSTVTAAGSVVGVLDVTTTGATQLVVGAAIAVGTATAQLTRVLSIASTVTAVGTATAVLNLHGILTSTVTATGSATATLVRVTSVVGTATAAGTASATLVAGVLLVGTTTAAGSVTTSLHVDRLIVSTVTAAASVTAVLDLTIGLVSTVTATGMASAVLSVDVGVTMVGTATASVTVSPDLTMVYAMTTTVTAYGFASAALTGGSIPGGPAAAPVTRQWSAVGYGRRRC